MLSRSFNVREPPSLGDLQSWITQQLQLSSECYELIWLHVENSSGELKEGSLLSLPHTLEKQLDQVMLVIQVTRTRHTMRAGRLALSCPKGMLYGLLCPRTVLQSVLGTRITLQQLHLLLSCQEQEQEHQVDIHSTSPPYLYHHSDELPQTEMCWLVALTLAGDRLRLIRKVRQNSEDAVKEAEQLFADESKDLMSLHLACACIAEQLGEEEQEARTFAQCEAHLFQKRMLARGLQPLQQPTLHQQNILESLQLLSAGFREQPLQSVPHQKLVRRALCQWHLK